MSNSFVNRYTLLRLPTFVELLNGKDSTTMNATTIATGTLTPFKEDVASTPTELPPVTLTVDERIEFERLFPMTALVERIEGHAEEIARFMAHIAGKGFRTGMMLGKKFLPMPGPLENNIADFYGVNTAALEAEYVGVQTFMADILKKRSAQLVAMAREARMSGAMSDSASPTPPAAFEKEVVIEE